MFYKAIGLMSGSSLDGLDLVFAEYIESAGEWSYSIKAAACYPYSEDWIERLTNATNLLAKDYLLLDAEYGKYTAEQVNRFVSENKLEHQVQLIGSHGHTSFHAPQFGFTGQLGNGATIAAVCVLQFVNPVVALLSCLLNFTHRSLLCI